MKPAIDWVRKLERIIAGRHTFTSEDLDSFVRAVQEDARGQWQPIDSRTPRDGTRVLLWGKDLLHTGACVSARYIAHESEFANWHVDDGKHGPFPLRGPSPTHWQPIPEPPEDEK